MLLRWIVAFSLSVALCVSFAQTPASNPVVDAMRSIGTKGLPAKKPLYNPGKFKPSGSRVFVASFAKSLMESADDRAALEAGLSGMIDKYEESMSATAYSNDASAALAFSVSVLYAAAKGEELPEESFPTLVDGIRSFLDSPAVRSATDRQKQEAYEWALCSGDVVLLTLATAQSEDQRAKVKAMAEVQLQALIGVKSDQITIHGAEVSIKPGALAEQPKQPADTGGLAAGFSFQAPPGWASNNGWFVFSTQDGTNVTSAHIRFLPPIPARGNMGDSLRSLWAGNVPPGLQKASGSMVYRRYVGAKLFSQFIFGKGREEGRRADSVFTLFLIDCGAQWQPVIVAQTYEDTGSIRVAEDYMAGFSYGHSADYAEQFLATLRCSGAPNQALATNDSLAGNYHFGSGATQQWENIYTGATSMTFASHGGDLKLNKDGSFTYNLTTASGQVGAATFRQAKGAGHYKIEGDQLICTFTQYDQGDSYKKKEQRYRIAGLTMFTDGVKIAVLMDDLKRPVNCVTVGDTSNWFSTKK